MIIKNIFRINLFKGVLHPTNDHKQNLLTLRSKPILKDSTKRQDHLTANIIKRLSKHFMTELQRGILKKHNIQVINTITNKEQIKLLNKSFLNTYQNIRSSDRS
jgi:hypothetical protein